ncbi:MAG: 3-phosphoshikimate 1-carboxyvinyltransferase [Gemmataceae bacterium]
MKKYTYPDTIAIRPLDRPVNATIRVPPSKSITNRALVLAALACRKGPCRIKNMLWADDTEVMVNALRQLGFAISITESDYGADAEVRTTNPLVIIPAREADLYVGNSGTTMRFLTAMVSLGHGRYRLDGDARMRERPIEDLLDALRQLGVDAKTDRGNGCPPVEVVSNGLHGGRVQIRGDVSSQFLSGLLMSTSLASAWTEIEIEGSFVSASYVNMTFTMLQWLSASPIRLSGDKISVPGNQEYLWSEDLEVEPDATSASYWFASAAINDASVTVEGSSSQFFAMQPDFEFLELLGSMGCYFRRDTPRSSWHVGASALVNGTSILRGITADMNHISDTAMTLAAVACFAEGPTTIRNVSHIRHKECDRIAAMTTELRKLGVEVEEYPDGWKITPRPMHGAELETYNDHRIAMSLALIGLKVPGVVIKDPGCVAKTYPGYWEDFEKLYK